MGSTPTLDTMFENVKNTKQQGDIGLGSAVCYFTQIGWTVCIPLNDSQEYDLVVDDGNNLLKVQVKTTSHKSESGNYKVLLKTCGGNQSFHTTKHFDVNKVDLLFVLCNDGSRYCIPTSTINNKSNLTLGKLYYKYKLGVTFG